MFEHEFQRKVLEELREIVRLLKPHHFTAYIHQCKWIGQEDEMAIGDITAGQTGTFAVELLVRILPRLCSQFRPQKPQPA